MKRLVSITLAMLILTVAFLTGCAKSPVDTTETPSVTTTASQKETIITTKREVKKGSGADFQYVENEDGTIALSRYEGHDSNLIIPEKINEKTVTAIRAGAIMMRDNLVSVVIPDTVTVIGENAFSLNKSLETVVLSKNLVEIQTAAFMGCTALTTIPLPEGLTTIGLNAFGGCASLKTIHLPDSIRSIGYSAFAGVGLESVELPPNLTYIAEYTFAGSALKEITIPSTITAIYSSAFSGCTNLKSVTLHNGLETIASAAFSENPQLTEIVIPATVTDVNSDSFEGCAALTSIKFEGDAPNDFESVLVSPEDCAFTIYYHKGAKGFTSPEWNGFKTAIW